MCYQKKVVRKIPIYFCYAIIANEKQVIVIQEKSVVKIQELPFIPRFIVNAQKRTPGIRHLLKDCFFLKGIQIQLYNRHFRYIAVIVSHPVDITFHNRCGVIQIWPANGNISFDGECIFYKNEQGVLTRYDVSSNETYTYENIVAYDLLPFIPRFIVNAQKRTPGICNLLKNCFFLKGIQIQLYNRHFRYVAYDFCMDEQSIYYISRTDGGCLYSCGKDGNNKELRTHIKRTYFFFIRKYPKHRGTC